MKYHFLVLFLLLSFTSVATDDFHFVKPLHLPELKWEHKFKHNLVTVSYKSISSNSIGFKYEIKIPMNFMSLAMFSNRHDNNRFIDSKSIYHSRFTDLDKLDLNAIVETNKLYNVSKSSFNLKAF